MTSCQIMFYEIFYFKSLDKCDFRTKLQTFSANKFLSYQNQSLRWKQKSKFLTLVFFTYLLQFWNLSFYFYYIFFIFGIMISNIEKVLLITLRRIRYTFSKNIYHFSLIKSLLTILSLTSRMNKASTSHNVVYITSREILNFVL